MSAALLTTSLLTKRFGGLEAICDLDFSVDRIGHRKHHRPEWRRQDHLLQLCDGFLPTG